MRFVSYIWVVLKTSAKNFRTTFSLCISQQIVTWCIPTKIWFDNTLASEGYNEINNSSNLFITDELSSRNPVVPKRADVVCSCVDYQCKEFQDNIQFMAGVKLTHIVGPTMCADKSWTIWHPISTVCKRVWLTWSHKICILVSVKHFSPTNVCVMTFTETDQSQTSKLSRSWASSQEAVNMAAPCWKLLWGWYVSGFKLMEDQEWA